MARNHEPSFTTPILSEFSRRAGRGAPLQAAVGFAAVAAVPLQTGWELAEWGEKYRADLDFRSPPDTFK